MKWAQWIVLVLIPDFILLVYNSVYIAVHLFTKQEIMSQKFTTSPTLYQMLALELAV